MAELIAYCGLDCSQCPAYIATQKDDKKGLAKTAAAWSKQFGIKIKPEEVVCDGCATPSKQKSSYCAMCEIRLCCIGKGKDNCALCEEYICKKLEKFFKEAPEAKKGLEKIRKKKKRT